MKHLVGGVKVRYQWFTQLNFSSATRVSQAHEEKRARDRSPLWSHAELDFYSNQPDIRHTSRVTHEIKGSAALRRLICTVIFFCIVFASICNEMNENGEEATRVRGTHKLRQASINSSWARWTEFPTSSVKSALFPPGPAMHETDEHNHMCHCVRWFGRKNNALGCEPTRSPPERFPYPSCWAEMPDKKYEWCSHYYIEAQIASLTHFLFSPPLV